MECFAIFVALCLGEKKVVPMVDGVVSTIALDYLPSFLRTNLPVLFRASSEYVSCRSATSLFPLLHPFFFAHLSLVGLTMSMIWSLTTWLVRFHL